MYLKEFVPLKIRRENSYNNYIIVNMSGEIFSYTNGWLYTFTSYKAGKSMCDMLNRCRESFLHYSGLVVSSLTETKGSTKDKKDVLRAYKLFQKKTKAKKKLAQNTRTIHKRNAKKPKPLARVRKIS